MLPILGYKCDQEMSKILQSIHKRKQKLTKEDIETPSNFRHIQHIGWNPNTGFNLENVDPKLIKFFELAGVSQEQLRNQGTRKFIYDFIDKHGGIDGAIQEVRRSIPSIPSVSPGFHSQKKTETLLTKAFFSREEFSQINTENSEQVIKTLEFHHNTSNSILLEEFLVKLNDNLIEFFDECYSHNEQKRDNCVEEAIDNSFSLYEEFMVQKLDHICIESKFNELNAQSKNETLKQLIDVCGEEKVLKDFYVSRLIKLIEKAEDKLIFERESLINSIERKKIEDSAENGRYNEEFNELSFIANGTYGTVSKAINKKNKRIFAIKKIPIYERSEYIVIKETDILSKLKSNFIVGFESVWIEENYLNADDFENVMNPRKDSSDEHLMNKTHLLHIQMEFCLMTLKEAIKKINTKLNQKTSKIMTPIGYAISSELFTEILEGIDYLHKHNVIHRDLKPNNILITDGKNGNFIKIADFGLATIHEFDGQSHTKYKGTIRYAAPEVMTNNYDTKADIYSLGVIVQELFNIDINTPIGKETILESKYSAIFKLIERMLSPMIIYRPDCQTILTERTSWALRLNELENQDLIGYESRNSQYLKPFIFKSLLFR